MSGRGIEPREFVYISPIVSFAQFDKPAPLVAALGQGGANALNTKVVKLADPQKTMIGRTRPDLSCELTRRALVGLPAMQQAKVKSYSVTLRSAWLPTPTASTRG